MTLFPILNVTSFGAASRAFASWIAPAIPIWWLGMLRAVMKRPVPLFKEDVTCFIPSSASSSLSLPITTCSTSHAERVRNLVEEQLLLCPFRALWKFTAMYSERRGVIDKWRGGGHIPRL